LVGKTYKKTEKVECERCGEHQAMHFGDGDLCCWCHIAGGGTPADWHTKCKELKYVKKR